MTARREVAVRVAPPGDPRDRGGLWWLAAPPTVWLLHFLACCLAVAIRCAKTVDAAHLGDVRPALWIATGVALALIGALAVRGGRRHRAGARTPPHDDAGPAERRRFLGFASLLLCVLSAIAVVYTALALAAIGTCR